MRTTMQLAYRCRRPASLMAAIAAFAILFLFARWFTGNFGFAGLSDDTIRDMAHFTVYGTLAVLVARALWDFHLLAWLIVALAATAEEIHQLFIQYRFACVSDWCINMSGITLFLLFSALLWPRLKQWAAASADKRLI